MMTFYDSYFVLDCPPLWGKTRDTGALHRSAFWNAYDNPALRQPYPKASDSFHAHRAGKAYAKAVKKGERPALPTTIKTEKKMNRPYDKEPTEQELNAAFETLQGKRYFRSYIERWANGTPVTKAQALNDLGILIGCYGYPVHFAPKLAEYSNHTLEEAENQKFDFADYLAEIG